MNRARTDWTVKVRDALRAAPDGMTAFELAQATGLGSEQVRNILRSNAWAAAVGVRGSGRQQLLVWKVKQGEQ